MAPQFGFHQHFPLSSSRFSPSRRCFRSTSLLHQPRLIPRRKAIKSTMMQDFFHDTKKAESLFSTYHHPLPTGTAKIALSRDIPLDTLSVAYGHILAKNIISDLPIDLDHDHLSEACRHAATTPTNPDPVKFDQYLVGIRSANANGRTPSLSAEQIIEFSCMYGAMLGRTVRLAALELHPPSLARGLKERLENPSLAFPMTDQEYDTSFTALQDCAANVLGTSNLEAADKFFDWLKRNPDIRDLQNDGYILSIAGASPDALEEAAVTLSDKVHIALRVRLLDGRVLVLPMFSDDGPDYVEVVLDQVPPSLSCAMEGMHAGESRTIFYHPYSACEIIGLFATAEFPPQSGLVVDIFLKRLVTP